MGDMPLDTIPAAVLANINTKVNSFKSSENIQKTGGWSYCPISDNQSSSVTFTKLTMETPLSL